MKRTKNKKEQKNYHKTQKRWKTEKTQIEWTTNQTNQQIRMNNYHK